MEGNITDSKIYFVRKVIFYVICPFISYSGKILIKIYVFKRVVSRVEISLYFFKCSWVLVGPGLQFANIEKTDRVTLMIRLVFLVYKKLIGAPSGASE